MIQDAVTLERRGIPTIAICTDDFEKASRDQARLQGLADVRIAVVPKSWLHRGTEFHREGERQAADAIFWTVLDALTAPA